MIATCVFLALSLLGGPQQQKSLFQKVVANPTGKNGYEEYVRAAEIVNVPLAGIFGSWNPEMPELTLDPHTLPEDLESERQRIKIFNEIRGWKLMKVRREFTRQFGNALELIRTGNQKPVFDPRESLTPETLFPELAPFKRLAHLFVADAYVKYADGNGAGATQSLLDGLTFTRKAAGGSIISSLVGISSTNTVLEGFEENLSRLSIKDDQRLIDYAEAALAEPPPLTSGLKREHLMIGPIIDYAFSDPKSFYQLSDGDAQSMDKEFASAVEAVKRSSPTQRESWKKRISELLSGIYDRLDSLLRRPENEWDQADAQVGREYLTKEDPTVRFFVEVTLPSFAGVTAAAARERTQLRLLGLHGRILAFRWSHSRLPNELKEAVPEALIADPLSGGKFVYELQSGGAYRLYSKGSADTGEIEIRYRRSTASGSTTLAPP